MRSSIDEASIAHWRALAGKFARLDHIDRRCDAMLAELIQRCLATDPAKRPTTVEVVAMCGRGFDWTDDAAAERAAVIADPIGYQRRVAPARVAGLIRAAREALAGRDLFGALRLCDRGLAYAADDAELLAIVATAGEAKTDTAIAADPDPKWRRLRAKARDGAGDVAGAQRDRADACQLGDAAACHE